MATATIQSTAPQAAFHALTCRHPAFVAGFGSGKTQTLVNQAFIDASHAHDSLVGIYAPTYSLIDLVHAPRMEERLLEFGVRYKRRKSSPQTISVSSPGMGDYLFGSMDRPESIVAYEIYTGHVDELDVLPTEKAKLAWEKVIGRCRQKPTGIAKPFNRVSAYSTPEGFKFMYQKWKKKPHKDYGMIQASSYSNHFLPDGYVEGMKNNYDPKLFAAYCNGQFVNLTSGSVYSQYDENLNQASLKFNLNECLHIGIDFNIGKMSACIAQEQPNGSIHVIDEIYGCRDTRALCDEIHAKFGEWDGYIYAYPDATNGRKTSSDTTDHQILREYGNFDVVTEDSNPGIQDRVNSVNKMLCNYNQYRALLIDPRCEVLLNGLETQAYDKNNLPDKDSDVDHICDALGYLIWRMRGIKKRYDEVY